MAAKTNRKANGIVKKNGALRVLVVGLGSMGLSHARAYDDLDGFALAGLCARTIGKRTDLPEAWSFVPRFSDFDEALAAVKPDVVSINTYPDTHAQYAIRAIRGGRARLCREAARPRRWRTPSASSTRRRRTAAS